MNKFRWCALGVLHIHVKTLGIVFEMIMNKFGCVSFLKKDWHGGKYKE